jgi:chromosome segregation ATPase
LIFRSLKIAGFKSFAENAEVDIESGLTGIVGPNGCGKSNIVEGLRWVMGESNARQMRGGEMDDVIFAGTDTRPARCSWTTATGLRPVNSIMTTILKSPARSNAAREAAIL